MMLSQELDRILAERGASWTPQDRERALRVAADGVDLGTRAAAGEDVDGALAAYAAAAGMIRGTAELGGRAAVRMLVERAFSIAVTAAVGALV